MARLYSLGWRQGSRLDADLTVGGLILTLEVSLVGRAETHGRWVIATQDCDLAAWDEDRPEPLVELRPRVVLGSQSQDWGIRSRVLRIDDHECVISDEPPIRLSPAALVNVAKQNPQPGPLTPGRIVALKTWLGLRYDRPAVPEHLVGLAKAIAKRTRRTSPPNLVSDLHDVLMQFNDQVSPPTFFLFAVVWDAGDKEAARRWLFGAGSAVASDTGILAGVDAGYRSEVSLELLETSYSADLGQLSWQGPDPRGVI